MAKKKSARKRPPVPMTASKAISTLSRTAEQPGDTRESPSSGVFEELYASELRRRAAAVAEDAFTPEPAPEPTSPLMLAQPKEAESGPKLTAKAHAREERVAAAIAAAEAAAAEDLADDTSIPPVDVEAEQFFAEGESRSSLPHLWGGGEEHEELVDDSPHSEHVRRASPEVLARRARLRKITQRVVGAFALIALVGLGKAALTRAPSAELPLQSSVAHAAAALPQEQPAETVRAAAPAVPAAAAPAAPEAVVAEPSKAEPNKVEEPAPVAQAVAAATAPEIAKPAEAPAAPAGDAKADKRAAQRAIDRGDNKGAVEAGERAIEADPDAETYLIVGAAYQQMGQNGKARQVFSACVSKATHGPKGECAALR